MSDEINRSPPWSRKNCDWLLSMVANIQGKCAVLRHENNKLRTENDRLRRDAGGPYRKLFYNALKHVDSIFQKCEEVPDPILPDFAELGENKFESCVRLAKEYAAERDTTPVDAEWLDRLMGPGQIGPDGKYTEWSTDDGTCEVTLWRDGPPVMSHKLHNIKIKPTRGDVLTALRLFGGDKPQ